MVWTNARLAVLEKLKLSKLAMMLCFNPMAVRKCINSEAKSVVGVIGLLSGCRGRSIRKVIY